MIHPYATERYALSLPHLGTPFAVPEWGSVVISRTIDDELRDVSGPYPLTALAQDADVAGGLERLRQAGFVSVTLVVDDYHRPPLEAMTAAFDVVRPFKTHHIVDRKKGIANPTKHHRYEIKRALEKVRTETFSLDSMTIRQCMGLYEQLKARHALNGVHDFPSEHFEALATLPGVTVVGAFRDETLLSFHIWIATDRRAHSHLAASSAEGYAAGAAYVVNDAALRFFADRDIINFGGSAGNAADSNDGLAKFKSGFCNATAQSYLCGKILDAERYGRLSAFAPRAGSYFPAYRQPH